MSGVASSLFFFNERATTEIYTLSLHDALLISYMDLVAELLRRDRERAERAEGVEADRAGREPMGDKRGGNERPGWEPVT